jgi:hypothetical protein
MSPEKLVSCVNKVSKTNPKFAWGICIKSTKLKPHKKKQKEV